MNYRKLMLLPTLVLAAAACSADATSRTLDATSLTASDYRFPAPPNFKLSPDTATLVVGQTLQIRPVYRDGDGRELDRVVGIVASYTSSNPAIATVDRSGTVEAHDDGVVTITGNANGKKAMAVLTVRAPAAAVSTSAPRDTGASKTASDAPAAPSTSDAPTAPAPQTPAAPAASPAPSAPVAAPATPQPPPPPPVSSASHGSLSGLQLVGDDFTGYSSTSALMARVTRNVRGGTATSGALYNDGWNANLASIDQSVTFDGHQTMRYDMPGGMAAVPGLWATFPNGQTLTKMWFRVTVRFSPGFTTLGTTPNVANAYKFLGWAWAGTDGRGSLEFTNIHDYAFVWGVATRDGSRTAVSAPQPTSSVGTEWSDGRWYDYVIYYEQTSPTTTRTRWWMGPTGGPLQARQINTGTMQTGMVPPANRIMLGMNFNSQRPPGAGESLWYGRWEVIDGTAHPDPFHLLQQGG